jgi:hypothetical protein
MRFVESKPMRLACFASLLAFTACQQRPVDRDACVSKYAQRGGTDQIVRWGYQLCAQAADPANSPLEREQAMCALEMIPTTPSEIAFRAVVARCRTSS